MRAQHTSLEVPEVCPRASCENVILTLVNGVLSDDVEKVVALLLREAGDKLDEEVRTFPIVSIKLQQKNICVTSRCYFPLFLQTKDLNLAAELFRNYSFFEKVMKTLLRRMGLVNSDPDRPGPQASPKAQIAVTCEVRSC